MDYPFKSDGCSVVPDYDQTRCCVFHDWRYWMGGTWRDRWDADKQFYDCIMTNSRFKFLAPFRWLGVRIGGVSFLPFRKWRWGYGWRYPRYKAQVDDQSEYAASQLGPGRNQYPEFLRKLRSIK